MDKNKKKTIATGLGGIAMGVGGTEAARHAKDLFDKEPPEDIHPEPGHNQDPVADTTANSNAANQQVAQQTSQPTPSHDDYSGITEIQPVDTGGANGETPDVVIEVPAEEPIAGVDDVNPDEIAETIITPVEDIIDNGTDLASNHQPSELEILSDDVIIDEDMIDEDEDDEDLAESDEDLTDDADDSVMIDDIS